jgi:hypothetical protein
MPVRKKGSSSVKVRPLLAIGVALIIQSTFPFPIMRTLAQEAVAPAIIERMAKEKEARRACKVEICSAFAKPAAGPPITCDSTKTWTRPEITGKILGGSYVWGYGHMQCSLKLTLDRGQIAKAMTEAKAALSFPEHAINCVVDDKDQTKGHAFTVSVRITPAIGFEGRQAKSVKLDPIKTEGSTLASAAVASIMAVDKASGFVSRTLATEINNFLFDRCKEEGIEIARD